MMDERALSRMDKQRGLDLVGKVMSFILDVENLQSLQDIEGEMSSLYF